MPDSPTPPPIHGAGSHVQRVSVRRAPRFSVFVVAGAALGLLVAAVLTFAFDGTENQSPNTGLVYTQGQVFGFLALIFVAVGIALAAGIALLLDRASRRRVREVTVDHETVQDPEV